jgi:phage terminase large subunit-like protein
MSYKSDSLYEIDNRVRPASKILEAAPATEENANPGAAGVHIWAARPDVPRRIDIPFSEMTMGEKVCEFIEGFCVVPEGELIGTPMVLAPFQVKFILDVYDNPFGTAKAYLTMARKNGKTALIAALLLAHVCGPLAFRNSQLVSGAMSREQAATVYNLAAKMIQLKPVLKALVFPVPSAKSLKGLEMGTEYRATSAEASTAHGGSPILVILDEMGQIKGPTSAFVDALETSQGAYANPLLIAISTQASDDNDLFSRWIDDALLTQDPKIVCHVYAADPDADLMDEEAWASANPGLGVIRNEASLRASAEKAQRLPADEPTFRQLFLNQRVEAKAPYVSRSTWAANGEPPDPDANLLWYGGLDLSATVDLTAFVSVGFDDTSPEAAIMPRHVDCKFWTPESGIFDRSARDRVPYSQWWKEGHLIATPGQTVDYDYVAFQVVSALKVRRYAKIAFDRWNFDAFSAALLRAGLPQNDIDAQFIAFGQGFVSMAPALRQMDELMLNHRLRHGNHPVLAMCMRNCIVLTDPAGNRKLSKASRDKRIDGAIALTMAVGAMTASPEAGFDVLGMIG